MSLEQRVADLERELEAARRELAEARAEAGRGAFFRAIVETSIDPFVVIDKSEMATYVSPSYEVATGRPAADLVGAHALAYTHPENRSRVAAQLAELLKSAPGSVMRVESRHRAKNGEWLHTEIVARNLCDDPSVRGAVLVVRNVSAAVRLREELRTTQARYELAMAASNEAVWEQDLATGALSFSAAMADRLGYTQEEFPRTSDGIRDLYHPDDRLVTKEAADRHLAGGPSMDVEVRVRNKSNDYRWYRVVGKALYAEDGRALRLVGQASDVHERKAAEIALRNSERMFRALFEDTNVAVTVRDVATQKFIDCNPAALRLYGVASREALFDTTPDKLAVPTQPDGTPSTEVLRSYVEQALRDGGARMEWMARKPNGEVFPADVHTTVIALEGGRRIMQTMIEDVTERRRNVSALEERARRDDLVSRVSRRFVQSGAEVALPFALEALGTFLGADRVRMRCLFDGGTTLLTLEEWRAPGIPSHPHPREDATTPIYRFVIENLERHGYVVLTNIDMLPPELRGQESQVRPTTTRALLVLPIANQRALIGWVVIELMEKARSWSDDDIATARLITEIVAMGRARAEAEEKTRRRATHDELLSEVSRRFLNDDPEAATGVTVERLGKSLDAESVSLLALDERSPRLRCSHRWAASAVSPSFEALEEYPVPAGTFTPVEGVQEGAPRVYSHELSAWLETLQRDSGKRALYAPVGYGGQVFGLLCVKARDGRGWTEDDAVTLRLIGELIAVGRVRRAAEVALARAKEDAIAASLTKSAFLANMSHELRTPLNGVIGMVDLLATTALDERQRRYTEIAGASANLLLSVISDILDFSKIEAGKLEIEAVPVSVNDIVEEVASILALSAEEKGLELSCRSDLALAAPLIGDPARLRQVLVNLVSNAIKFTRHGEVSVRASLVSESAEVARVRLEVRDTGVGIPPHAQAKLFQPFTQVDASTTREHGGSGLGLAICRELTERMRGTIGLQSTPGKGSVFWIEVTLDRPRGGASFTLERDPRLAGLRVLAVDDNATNREVLDAQLTAAGMVCETAADGFAAMRMLVDAASARPYALAVLDHHMPGMDGRELAKRMKGDPRLNDTRVVMLGSVANPLDVSEQRAVGILGYCTKPIWRKQLLRVLREALDGGAEVSGEEHVGRSPRADAGRDRGGPARRILLVEDSQINAEVAGEILRSAGYEFDVAVDGGLAIEAAMSKKYDLVLMDCQLPEVDGFEATREIRVLEREGALGSRGVPLPIIALTASATKEDLDRCFAAGMNDHISKPVDARRLLAMIASRLRGGEPSGPLSSEPRSSGIPVADISRALERLAGDRALLRRIASLFADGAPVARAKLRAAVEAKTTDEVAFAVHRLRGQASTFGGDALVAAAGALEDAARRGNWTAAGAALLSVERELDRLLRALTSSAETRDP